MFPQIKHLDLPIISAAAARTVCSTRSKEEMGSPRILAGDGASSPAPWSNFSELTFASFTKSRRWSKPVLVGLPPATPLSLIC